MDGRSPLDPLSQTIGAISAQVSDLSARVGELKGEILQNRLASQTHREQEIKAWQQVEAELRNIKHEERGLEQKTQIIESKMERVGARLSDVEITIARWQAKLAIVSALAAAGGGVIGIILDGLLTKLVWKII